MFEAYKIGIRISLINQAGIGLMALSKSFLNAEGDAKKLQDRIHSIQKMALKGALTLGAGIVGLSLFKGPLKEATAYQNQLSNLNVLGMKQAEIAEVVGKAWQVSRSVMTSTAVDNIKAYRELRSAFGAGHEHQALSVLPQVQMASGILEAVSGKKQAHVGFDMVKAIELGTKGAISTGAIQRQAEMMTQAIVGMGGTITVADFHQALKYARTAAPYLSEEFKYKYLPTLIQEMKTGGGSGRGASGAGNTIASLYGMIAGRMIPKDLMQNWVDAELVKRGMMVANKQHTGTAKILPGGIAGSTLFTQNPLEWANQYAAPAIQKLMATQKLSEVDAYYALTKNRIAAFGLQTLVNKAQQFERDRQLIEQASGIDAYRKLVKTNPQLATQGLHKQWQNLKTQIGIALLPQVMQGMRGLTNTLILFNRWTEKNTGVVKGLSLAFAVLSGALAFRGTVLLLAAAFDVLSLSMFGGLGGVAGKGASIFSRFAKSRPVGFLSKAAKSKPAGWAAKHLVKEPLGSIAKYSGLSFLFRAITKKINLLRLSGAIVGKSGLFSSAIAAIGSKKHIALLSKKIGRGLGKAGSGLRAAGQYAAAAPWLGGWIKPVLAGIGRWVMFGLRAIPIIGWVVMAVTLGVWLWRNWDTVCQKACAIWGMAGKMIIGAWVWVKERIGPIWTAIKNSLSRGFKTFVWWFLDQWQFLFNALIAGINKILPKAWELNRLTFADRYRERTLPDKESRYIAPVHYAIQITSAPVILDGRQVSEVVFRHAEKKAAVVTSATGTRYDLSIGAPHPALNAAW